MDAPWAVEETVAWTKAWLEGADVLTVMKRQMDIFLKS